MGWQETLWLLTSFILSVTKAGTTETKAEPTTDLSFTPVMMAMEGERLIMTQSQYKCLELLGRDGTHNKTGSFCSRFWDGLLCWDETPAGTFTSQNCPDYPSFDPLEKVTKYCDESGNWVLSSSINKTWSHCLTFSKEKIKTLPVHGFLETETEMDPTAESQVSPVVTQKVEERKKIINGQYKCFEKMNRDQPYNKSGPYCNRTWDGWLCWDDTPAATYTSQNCPNYFPDFDSTEKVTKYCDETGNWFRHPETNRTWSNYTLCIAHTKDKLKMAYILYYMAIVGHALSIVSLLISLSIFFYFRSLSCQRITLHKNLFCSYVLNSAFTIVNLITVVNNPKVVQRNPIGCKVLHFFHMYMLGCNYFWMLCEGIYLHTLIVVAVFAEEQHLHWYYLLGWGFPLVPASIHAVARKKYFDDNCWMSVDTHLLYVVHGPIMAALLVNLFFLLNIVRVLVTKLRDTHRAESNMYMKAVRATLILVPLLGIQFVIFPWRPENRLAGEIYDYIMHILMNYQGLLVATIFCFFNGEVQGTLKRQWMQYKAQWGQRRREHCSTRSTSYTATSITEVPTFMYHHDCNSEHLNGKQTEDSELVALKTGETYA
ncbi:calcitonin gene-related peptide type 1 receptor-like [Carassius carassius]|uniref:calcitonin gene-related peptide type 1 receptor-like n=1 Tax=Carassius carassius TaxID=217509 RepID=UPI00286877C3|nr:calcitonin gene-related peptide type 1 receptor-like [Carassius carassius]XP_059365631.1 calcitonin gene-related peptide type 1 receptor-like [Carassius carassius]XP_059365633.1 calcitonin gene-related peptide type 1 receptor-like [Carassius carassius]